VTPGMVGARPQLRYLLAKRSLLMVAVVDPRAILARALLSVTAALSMVGGKLISHIHIHLLDSVSTPCRCIKATTTLLNTANLTHSQRQDNRLLRRPM
jgi:hypothetical protein